MDRYVLLDKLDLKEFEIFKHPELIIGEDDYAPMKSYNSVTKTVCGGLIILSLNSHAAANPLEINFETEKGKTENLLKEISAIKENINIPFQEKIDVEYIENHPEIFVSVLKPKRSVKVKINVASINNKTLRRSV